MPAADYRDQLAQPVRALQLITIALLGGVVMFAAIVRLIPAEKIAPRPGDATPIITYVAMGFGVSAFVIGHLLTTVMVTAVRRRMAAGDAEWKRRDSKASIAKERERVDVGNLIKVYSAKTIVGAAVFEGASLFLLVAYMIERKAMGLIVVVPLFVALIMMIPSRDRIERWIDRQLRQLAEDMGTL
jgi:hypothetical protein